MSELFDNIPPSAPVTEASKTAAYAEINDFNIMGATGYSFVAGQHVQALLMNNMNTISDTPRTDAAQFKIYHNSGNTVLNEDKDCDLIVSADFARHLELELHEARSIEGKLKPFIAKMSLIPDDAPICDNLEVWQEATEAELATLRAERDRLKAELESMHRHKADAMTALQKMDAMVAELATLRAELEEVRLAAKSGDYCRVNAEYWQGLADELDRIQRELAETHAQLAASESEWAGQLHKRETEWDEERDRLKAELAEALSTIEKSGRQGSFETWASLYMQRNKLTAQLSTLRAELKSLHENTGQGEGSMASYSSLVQSYRLQRETSEKLTVMLQTANDELSTLRADNVRMKNLLAVCRATFVHLHDRHGAQSAKLRSEEIAALASTPAQPDPIDRALIIQLIQREKAKIGTPGTSWSVSEDEIQAKQAAFTPAPPDPARALLEQCEVSIKLASEAIERIYANAQFCDCESFEHAQSWRNETHREEDLLTAVRAYLAKP